MFKKFIICLCALFFLITTSCTMTNSIGTVGELPNEWWKKTRGNLQNSLRSEGKGYYSNVLIFIGESDSVRNYSESQALDSAKLDANAALSEYIIAKVTTILKESVNNNLYRETDGSSDEEIERTIEEVSNSIKSAVSVTQFSSFMVEGKHTEECELNGIKFYKGWVCCTIGDDIVKAIQEIQKEAFETVIKGTENYSPVMDKIQEDTSMKLSEIMLDELGGNSSE